LDVRTTPIANDDPRWDALDAGERAALALALELKADLVLMDDRDGVAVAHRQGLAVTGTLSVLDLAARQHLVDLADAFTRLKATNFRIARRYWTRCWRGTGNQRSAEGFLRGWRLDLPFATAVLD